MKTFGLSGLLLLLSLTLAVRPAMAQTCSCAGAPLISSQSAGASGAGQWVFGATYEYHEISSVYYGSELLTEDETSRNTQSLLMEINYGITDRLSASGTFTYVHKERTSGRLVSRQGSTVSTSGIGDGLVTMNYTLIEQTLWNRLGWQITAGGKFPFGSTSHTHSGFRLNADMQPGTGAWDGVAGTRFSVSLLPWANVNMVADATFRKTGSNERFGEEDIYEFGNELVANFGAAGEINRSWSYLVQARYRSTTSDRRNDVAMPNTGGYWLTLEPAVNYGLSERTGFRLSGRVPIHQNLNGTQPSTTFAVSASVFINFNQPEQEFNYGNP